jgi:hypothetical protein
MRPGAGIVRTSLGGGRLDKLHVRGRSRGRRAPGILPALALLAAGELVVARLQRCRFRQAHGHNSRVCLGQNALSLSRGGAHEGRQDLAECADACAARAVQRSGQRQGEGGQHRDAALRAWTDPYPCGRSGCSCTSCGRQ